MLEHIWPTNVWFVWLVWLQFTWPTLKMSFGCGLLGSCTLDISVIANYAQAQNAMKCTLLNLRIFGLIIIIWFSHYRWLDDMDCSYQRKLQIAHSYSDSLKIAVMHFWYICTECKRVMCFHVQIVNIVNNAFCAIALGRSDFLQHRNLHSLIRKCLYLYLHLLIVILVCIWN